MRLRCRACGMDKQELADGVNICLRCDTSQQTGSMRVGPPNTPGTNNGWFTASFGETK